MEQQQEQSRPGSGGEQEREQQQQTRPGGMEREREQEQPDNPCTSGRPEAFVIVHNISKVSPSPPSSPWPGLG